MAMRLSDVIKQGRATDPMIAGVTADSRQVKPGFLFAALPGVKVDGRAFIPAAVAAGAAAVLVPSDTPDQAVPTVRAGDVRRAYALAAAAFHGAQPAVRKPEVIALPTGWS